MVKLAILKVTTHSSDNYDCPDIPDSVIQEYQWHEVEHSDYSLLAKYVEHLNNENAYSGEKYTIVTYLEKQGPISLASFIEAAKEHEEKVKAKEAANQKRFATLQANKEKKALERKKKKLEELQQEVERLKKNET